MRDQGERGSRSTYFNVHGTLVPARLGSGAHEDKPRADHTPVAPSQEAGKSGEAEMSQAVVAGDPGSHATSIGSEEWRPVAGFAGYEVSSLGQVRRGGRLIRGAFTRRGGKERYLLVSLSVSGKVRQKTIHSLVAEAFIGARPEGMQVDHVNGDKSDNRAANLEYVSPSENTRRAHALRKVARDLAAGRIDFAAAMEAAGGAL